ncbi:MAG: glutathione S-transferase family protein [Acidiferrobacterales bacterium]
MKLYGSLTSPYVRKVRVLLKEKGIACDLVVEGPSDPAGNVAELNPLGKIPVMARDDNEVLFDSPLIVDYLDSLKGEPLIPRSGEVRWQVLRWHALGQGMLDAIVARLYEVRRPPEKQLPEFITRQESKILAALTYADKAKKGPAYLVGERFSLADLALGVALEYIDFRFPHDWRDRHPRLAHWLAGISTRGSFAETVPPGMEKSLDAPH